jgi:hypothetical protein
MKIFYCSAGFVLLALIAAFSGCSTQTEQNQTTQRSNAVIGATPMPQSFGGTRGMDMGRRY